MGAGRSTIVFRPRGRFIRSPHRLLLSARSRRRREHDDPDAVDEVPVEREHVVRCACSRRTGRRAPAPARRQADEPDDHVQGVQADQRVEGRAEEVRADRQPVLVDEPRTTRARCRRGRPRRARSSPATTAVNARARPRRSARTASAIVTLLDEQADRDEDRQRRARRPARAAQALARGRRRRRRRRCMKTPPPR